MRQRVLCSVVAGILLMPSVFAGETGMSYDGSGDPNDPKPRFAPPGAGTTPKPQMKNTTPLSSQSGVAPLQGGVPHREVQPGTETPQADDATSGGGTRQPRGGLRSSGDDDDMDDQEVQRHTVQGMEVPGRPSKGSAQVQSGGGDGTQTEDELYVGRKATDTPLGDRKQNSKDALPNASRPMPRNGNSLSTQPLPLAPEAAIVLPRANCGTSWTGWVDDPSADVNPCPKTCERGERQVINRRKEGKALKYQARYQCYLPQRSVSRKVPGVSMQTEGGKPRANCGTFWTGRVNDLNAKANPCPRDCEPGELQLVDRHLSGNGVQYNKRYQCFKAEPATTKPTSSLKPQTGTARAADPGARTALPGATQDPWSEGGKPKLLPPTAVTGFAAKSAGPDRIELSWNPASAVTEYRLARKDLAGNIHIFIISAVTYAKSYTDTGLRPSTYSYTIVPINTAGENAVDPPSASATVAPVCNPASVALRSGNGQERCFGAVGMQCAGGRMGTKKENGIAEAAAPPGVINSDCTITQDVAVGSIMHDNCCVTNHGNGAYCSGEAPGTDELDPVCMREWRKAVWNKIDGRFWRQTFGPYLTGDQGDQLGTTTARPAKTNGLLGFRDDPQPWPGPERYATSQLKAPPGTPLDIDSAAYCASGRFSLTDWKGPALTKGSDYAKWIADKENEIRGRDDWINGKIAEKDAAWRRGDLIKVGALEVEINAARAQNTLARADLGKLVALRDAQYLARVTEWGVCQ